TYVPVTFGQGQLSIPPGFLDYTLIEQTGNLYPSPDSLCGDGVFSGVLEYQLPAGTENLDIETLTLHIADREWWSGTPTISLYDWQEESWQAIEDTATQKEIVEDVGHYVRPAERTIRIKIENDTQNTGGCLFLNISLKGVNR
ncbi:MAG: hypothetical protein SVX38_07745, partial [Chloroflexota bacterium]|nr:hypothetical protein [Chloroflexota bacterium]